MNLELTWQWMRGGDILADPRIIVSRWNNYFFQLLSMQGVGGVRQTEIHAAEPFVPA
jgi:hypothetical protein